MSTFPNPHQEHSSTYIVQDRSNQEELARVRIQGQMITTCMGGVLPEQPDPHRFKRVLDVGCGTGEWLIEMAKTYPDISLLIILSRYRPAPIRWNIVQAPQNCRAFLRM